MRVGGLTKKGLGLRVLGGIGVASTGQGAQMHLASWDENLKNTIGIVRFFGLGA